MDLISLVLTLRPLPAPDPTRPLPAWWGRAAHRLLLEVAGRCSPALAEALHEPPERREPRAEPDPHASALTLRPFTTSTLRGRFLHGVLDPRQAYRLRLTALTAELSGILAAAAAEGPLRPGAEIELDFQPFRVEAAASTAEPRRAAGGDSASRAQRDEWFSPADWAGSDDYPGLSAGLLLAKAPAPRRVTLRFAGPTTFKSGGKHVPVPLPELVFGSLLERWNAFAPIAFPPETKRFAAECLAISRYELRSAPVPGKSGSLRMGGVGQATYTTLNYDRYWMSVIGVLAAFAKYSGVGAGTTGGLGQCRQVWDGPDDREHD